MLTGELRNKVDGVWDAFWTGGVANPLTVIEQMTYLLFAKGLDERQTALELRANVLHRPIEEPVFQPEEYDLRWSRFREMAPEAMFVHFRDRVFPWLKDLHGGRETSYARFMKDAVFVIPRPQVLARVVDMLDAIPMERRDVKGDLYEYLLSKLSIAGKAGQFRTPRHIIDMMVALRAPTVHDTIADPACGTCGFLVRAAEYVRKAHEEALMDDANMAHFRRGMFHGADFDASMLRIGAMNMAMHGIDDPDIRDLNSLAAEGRGIERAYSLVLANPPFKGAIDETTVSKDLMAVAKTKKTELLFLALILRQLKPGGRCAVIVPDGVTTSTSNAYIDVRKALIDDHRLEGVVSMPSGVFKPYAGVSTTVLMFTRTDSGGTDDVWFYDMAADGYSLDDKRTPTGANDIPDVLARWAARDPDVDTDRNARAFFVSADEIRAKKYDLSINRYRTTVHEAVEHESPLAILDRLKKLECEILGDLDALKGMLV